MGADDVEGKDSGGISDVDGSFARSSPTLVQLLNEKATATASAAAVCDPTISTALPATHLLTTVAPAEGPYGRGSAGRYEPRLVSKGPSGSLDRGFRAPAAHSA